MTDEVSSAGLKLAEELSNIRAQAPTELKAKTTMDGLEQWRLLYLDDVHGKIPQILRQISTLPSGEQRLLNELAIRDRQNLEWELAYRRQDLFKNDPEGVLHWLYNHALQELETLNSSDYLHDWEIRYLGRERGAINLLIREIGKLPGEKRKSTGELANRLKRDLEARAASRQTEIKTVEDATRIERERLDVTLPGRTIPQGHIHPLMATIREIVSVMGMMGFQLYDGPEVETDYYNFQALNIPQDHPSRDMQDTFWIVPGQVLLRTQTSPMQIHVMEHMSPPVRAIVIGKVYRNEATDASHEAIFHQCEGLLIDEHCTMSDLRGVVERFAREMFGADRKVRFRPSYFPFTEPSAEFDIDCMTCKGAGCRVCKYSGWLEMGGSGMVDPRVLRGVGYNPDVYRGFAFGLGIERIAMLRHGIDDIRLFQGNDLRFLRQFS